MSQFTQFVVSVWSTVVDFIRDGLPHGLVMLGVHNRREGDEPLGTQVRRLLASSVIPLLVGGLSAYIGIQVGVARLEERLAANFRQDEYRLMMQADTRKMLADHIRDFESFKDSYYNGKHRR